MFLSWKLFFLLEMNFVQWNDAFLWKFFFPQQISHFDNFNILIFGQKDYFPPVCQATMTLPFDCSPFHAHHCLVQWQSPTVACVLQTEWSWEWTIKWTMTWKGISLTFMNNFWINTLATPTTQSKSWKHQCARKFCPLMGGKAIQECSKSVFWRIVVTFLYKIWWGHTKEFGFGSNYPRFQSAVLKYRKCHNEKKSQNNSQNIL